MVVHKLLMCPTSNHHQNFLNLEYAIDHDKAHTVKVFKMIFNTVIACYLY